MPTMAEVGGDASGTHLPSLLFMKPNSAWWRARQPFPPATENLHHEVELVNEDRW
jgi:fumarylpyruvate hydrolase